MEGQTDGYLRLYGLYMNTYIYIYVYLSVCIYTQIEREREMQYVQAASQDLLALLGLTSTALARSRSPSRTSGLDALALLGDRRRSSAAVPEAACTCVVVRRSYIRYYIA